MMRGICVRRRWTRKQALKASSSQFDLNGDFCQNMWIVKPAAKSRGRGIECFTELDKILDYTDSRRSPAVSQWVVHKYMEVGGRRSTWGVPKEERRRSHEGINNERANAGR